MSLSNWNQNNLSLIALVVSLVALVTTIIQVLQQYYSSAEGYRRCALSVMGPWAKSTKRKIRWTELRFEVLFETPVIFVAKPTNLRGPVKNKPIHYIDGTTGSYMNTQVLSPMEQESVENDAVARVHTADDERASWYTLLSALQGEESQSRHWDATMRLSSVPGTFFKPPEYELTVGLQKKTRSWDFIPSSITKPYATSAICHLVEMMAMLGLYWKSFDQSSWNLRAEGNGYILTSTTVQRLGLMVVFSVTGSSTFKENRVIPCDAVKKLAFGNVPNIFEDDIYLNRETDAQSLELVFGTDDEVATTLEALGCQADTLKRYKVDHKHIFSVSFEIIGMLGQVFRIRGSNFRMLPNPTSDSWLKKIGAKASWKTTRLMQVFQAKLQEFIDNEGLDTSNSITKISNEWKAITGLSQYPIDETNLSINVREAIHDAIDRQTEYLLSLSQADVLNVLVAHITEVTKVLADQFSPLNTIVLANKEEALISHYFSKIRPDVVGHYGSDKNLLTKREKEHRNEVWIRLIFRMLCWFLLHDFDKADVKIVPSDLKGSRMPVFIG